MSNDPTSRGFLLAKPHLLRYAPVAVVVPAITPLVGSPGHHLQAGALSVWGINPQRELNSKSSICALSMVGIACFTSLTGSHPDGPV